MVIYRDERDVFSMHTRLVLNISAWRGLGLPIIDCLYAWEERLGCLKEIIKILGESAVRG